MIEERLRFFVVPQTFHVDGRRLTIGSRQIAFERAFHAIDAGTAVIGGTEQGPGLGEIQRAATNGAAENQAGYRCAE